jgi:hypothetical protein
LTDEVMKKGFELFGRAFALADDDEIYRRVRVASMPLRYWEVYTMPPDNPKRAGKVERFIADCAELEVHSLREGCSFQDSAKMLRKGEEFQNLIQ